MTEATEEKGGRQLTMPVQVVGVLIVAVVSGLTSGGVASSASSASTREGQIRLEAQLQAVRDELRRIGDDTRAGFARHEVAIAEQAKLTHELQVWRAQVEAWRAQIDAERRATGPR